MESDDARERTPSIDPSIAAPIVPELSVLAFPMFSPIFIPEIIIFGRMVTMSYNPICTQSAGVPFRRNISTPS